MTAEQFEAAWRRGRRTFEGTRVEVSPAYVELWERRTADIRHERDAWLALVDAEPGRRGNWLRLVRVADLDAELRLLALVRDRVQALA